MTWNGYLISQYWGRGVGGTGINRSDTGQIEPVASPTLRSKEEGDSLPTILKSGMDILRKSTAIGHSKPTRTWSILTAGGFPSSGWQEAVTRWVKEHQRSHLATLRQVGRHIRHVPAISGCNATI